MEVFVGIALLIILFLVEIVWLVCRTNQRVFHDYGKLLEAGLAREKQLSEALQDATQEEPELPVPWHPDRCA
jgi:hypothetical protein